MSSKVLAEYPSSSSDKVWKVSIDDNYNVWCDCPGWRFHNKRYCKHIAQWESSRKPSTITHQEPSIRGSMQIGRPQVEKTTEQVIQMLRRE